MNTFSQILSASTYTEVLAGNSSVAFDCNGVGSVRFIFTTNGATPGVDDDSNPVYTWAGTWDFEATGLEPKTQRIWVKGDNIITGIRG